VFCAVDAGGHDSHLAVMAHLETYNWIIFTSQITVLQFAALMKKYETTLTPLTRLAAIGGKTKRAMEKQGWRVDFVSDVADAVSLGESFMVQLSATATDGNPSSARLLFPCSAKASHELEIAAAKSGINLERLVCYDTIEHPDLAQTVASLPQPDIVVFTSPALPTFS